MIPFRRNFSRESNCRAAAINQRAVNVVTDGYHTMLKDALQIADGEFPNREMEKAGPRIIKECADAGDWWAQWIYQQVGVALEVRSSDALPIT